MKKNQLLIGLALMGLSSSCFANVVIGAGYLNINNAKAIKALDNDKITRGGGNGDVNLGAIAFNVGYQFKLNQNFSVTPELQASVGVGDDKFSYVDAKDATKKGTAKVKMDSYFAFNVRGAYNFTPQFSVFIMPSVTRVKLKAKYSDPTMSGKASDSETKFGLGGGLQYMFTDNLGASFAYQKINSIKANSFKFEMRYYF
ncbi:outer membrane protein [Parashewanella tropica]|uniref:outer membrane protein n=1 Tax=Parashewanella tropica TaxID=2547970 RepID=UPI00105979CA|nr:outer membrane beta-barrel protein [Parashewanella tropica]